MPDFGTLRRYLALPSRTRTRVTRDVDDELREHIASRAEELERAGMSREEACETAMRLFGDLDDATRYCATIDRRAERRSRLQTMVAEVWQDATHALRAMRLAPSFTAATVLTLAVAIGASTAVYGVLDTYLIRALPFPEPDRLVSIMDAPSERFQRSPSLRDVDWSSADSLFEATATWDLDGFTITGGDHAENVTGAWVSRGFFPTLRLGLAIGRGFRDDEFAQPAPVAILSHALWVRRFHADTSVIGSTITVHSTDRPNETSAVTIIGVTPRDFWPIHWRDSDLLRPLPPDPSWMPALARLKPGVTREQTQARFEALVRAQIKGDIDPAWHTSLVPPLDRHSARARPLLTAMLAATIFMLLAACGSVAGALVSRMAARRSELAVRLALGGSRGRIVRQLLTESAVMATLAGAVGLVVAYVLLDVGGPFVERQIGTKVPGGAVALRPTAPLMMLSIVASALAGIALGIVPALVFVRRARLGIVLGSTRATGAHGGAARVRRTLIAGQVALAMVLLFGAGLMFRTIAEMHATRLGFDAEGLIKGTVLLPLSRYPDSTGKRVVMDRLLARLSTMKGVEGAAATYPYPFGGSWNMPVTTEGAAGDAESAPKTMVYTVSPAYFETMKIPLRAGRRFDARDDHASPLVVVVSEALARRVAPAGDAIGRRIRVRVPHLASFDDDDKLPLRTVIGVVGDTRKEFAASSTPDVYVPYAQNPRALQSLVVRVRQSDATAVEALKRAVSSVDPALALSGVESIPDVIADAGGQRRGLTILLGTFASFALALSALALYASLSYTVVQRRTELAVRLAVGANTPSILRLVVGEGLTTAAIGIGVGAVASLAAGRVLRAQVYGVGTTDPGTLALISVVLAVAVVAACAVPGLRATRTDPALALRD
jgi:putative ABC transport system permease protein